MSENVPVALYSGYMSVFDGLTITLKPESASVQNLKATNVEIIATLRKYSTPLQNIPLNAQFLSGTGKITPSTKTNRDGEGRFYLTQLTSKEASQSIKISIDNSILKDLPQVYQNKKTSQKLPEALFTMNVEQSQIRLGIYSINDALPALVNQIASVLSSDNFDVSTNLDEVTHILYISTDLRFVDVVNGDLENLEEWFASLVVTLKSKDGAVLTHYSEEDVRILVPENSSQKVAVQQATKELLKRFKREFPKHLEKVNIK